MPFTHNSEILTVAVAYIDVGCLNGSYTSGEYSSASTSYNAVMSITPSYE